VSSHFYSFIWETFHKLPFGRTARGFNKGTAISFASIEEKTLFEQIQREVNDRSKSCDCLSKYAYIIFSNFVVGHPVIRPYEVNMKDFEAFQLRARDVLAACTRTVIREVFDFLKSKIICMTHLPQTRMAEIREELLHSRRLDSYFAKNPRERWAFEQDRKQFKLNVHSAGIADVPDYMGKFGSLDELNGRKIRIIK
jgi:ATP-dependent RNA helicase DDX56/DBP9